jgi:hypothetical protein
LWVAVVFVLDDLLVVQVHAHDEGGDEGGWTLLARGAQLGEMGSYCTPRSYAPSSHTSPRC